MDDKQNDPPTGSAPNQPNQPGQPIDGVGPAAPNTETGAHPDFAAALAETDNGAPGTVPTAPQSTAAPETPAFDAAKKPRKKHKAVLWIVGIIVVLGAAFAVWWFAYFNNDKAILKGAFNNLVSQQVGTMDMNLNLKPNDASAFGGISEINFDARTVSNSNEQADFSLDIKSETISAKLTGGLFTEPNGNIYVKLGGLTPLVDTATEMMGASSTQQQSTLDTYITPIVEEIDNQWIEISQEDLDSLTGTEDGINTKAMMQCLTNLNEKIADSSSLRQNLFEALQSENVLNVERVGQDSDGIKYKLTVDGKADLQRFGRNLAETDIAKEATDCMKNAMPEGTFDEIEDSTDVEDVETATSNIFGEADVTINFWVDRTSREARRLELNVVQDNNTGGVVKFTMTNDYSEPSVPVAPTDTISLMDLISDIQDSLAGLITQSQSSTSTSSQQTDDDLEELLLEYE